MPVKPKSILFVLEHFHPYIGGVETLFRTITTQLVARGWKVTVVTTRHLPSLPLRDSFEGVTIRRVNALNRYLFTLMALPVVVGHARRNSFIHTSTYNAALPAMLAGLLTRRRVYITVHEVWGKLWYKLPWMSKFVAWWHNLYERFLLKLPYARLVAVSDFTAASLVTKGISPSKIIRIYNGLDNRKLEAFGRRFSLLPRDQERFVYYGRLGHSKGLDIIIAGGAMYLKEHPEACVELIIPDTPVRFRRKVEKAIIETNLSERFILTPSLPQEDLYESICKATAVLIPSYSEGFCFAAAEASALGARIITSGQGALPETVSGVMVSMERTDPLSLCKAMERAAEGSFEYRKKVSFPVDQMVDQYLHLFEEEYS